MAFLEIGAMYCYPYNGTLYLFQYNGIVTLLANRRPHYQFELIQGDLPQKFMSYQVSETLIDMLRCHFIKHESKKS